MTTTVRYTHVTCINRIKGRKRWYFVYIRWRSAVRQSRDGVLRDDDDGRRNRCLLCERPFKGSISQRSVCVYVCTYIYIIGSCVCGCGCVCESAHARNPLHSCSENVYIIHYIAANTPCYETAFDKTLRTPSHHRTTPFHFSFDVRFPAPQTLTTTLTVPAAPTAKTFIKVL